MDPRSFDALARSLAAPKTRRGLLGGLAALGAGLLGARASDAQVSQTQCGNVFCGSNPGVCTNGCVCCVYTNSVGQVTNSRCRPPGTCSPGTEVRGTTTPAPTTTTGPTTTTAAPPTTTTTSTTTTTTSTTTAAPVSPAISAVVTPSIISGSIGFFVDVSGTGFTPSGTVNFFFESLGGEQLIPDSSTVAGTNGAFGPFRLFDGSRIPCVGIGHLQQALVTARDATTGLTDTETVDLPCTT